ncbi:hypothetical protein AJ79_08093 [Helicocarpus griseus UAMH5409]|uniref:Uncharacterized protein n=1 Tax=Helicocarpus griseus UAMH5409 TaxID=1447875 RepID=A0A2B7WWH3_9EURO|nr:hypothetical protein AJ79_08093 [Helicocarpus griseus UAMH5409]
MDIISKLPSELCGLVLEHLVLIEGFPRAVGLRLVSKWFEREITRAILATSVLLREKRTWYRYRCRDFWASNQLQHMILSDGGGDNYLISVIRHSVKTLLLESCQEPTLRGDEGAKYAVSLSEAAVFYFYGRRLLDILQYGKAANVETGISQTPDAALHILCAAAYVGHTQLVESLLKQGTDCNLKSDVFGRPLCLAAFRGNIDIVKLLLAAGAKPQAYLRRPDNFNWHSNPRMAMIDLPETPLQAAAYGGKDEIVKELMQPKYDIPLSGVDYNQAVICALRAGHVAIAERLIDGRDLSKQYPGINPDVFEWALIEACREGVPDSITMCLNRGASANSDSVEAVPCLSFAAVSGSEDAVRILLENGADPNKRARSTPLAKAASAGHLGVVKLLLEYGAERNKVPRMQWPVMKAAAGGHEQVVRYLVENGCLIVGDEKYKGYSWTFVGQKAYERALENGHTSVAEALLELGVKPDMSL